MVSTGGCGLICPQIIEMLFEFSEGAQLSKCQSAATYVDGGSFKYFRGSFAAGTTKVTIELQDQLGKWV